MDSYNDNFTIGPGQVYTQVETIKFIAQGSAPNYTAHALFHLSMDANGDVTASFSNLAVDCR
jgi:hypothetical protein